MTLTFDDIMDFCVRYDDDMPICKRGMSHAAKELIDSDDEELQKMHPLRYVAHIGGKTVREAYCDFGKTYTEAYDILEFGSVGDVMLLYIGALLYKINCGIPYSVVFRFESRENRALIEKNCIIMAKLMEIRNLISIRCELI